MNARKEVPPVRGWPEPGVVRSIAVTQGLHVRAILGDPCGYLVGRTGGAVAGDDDVHVARGVLEESQRGQVVPDRIRGAAQVEHRNQDIGKHVTGDENAGFLDQQRRMARRMCLMLDNPDFRAFPRDVCRPRWQT